MNEEQLKEKIRHLQLVNMCLDENNKYYQQRIDKAIEWCECVVNAEKEGVYLPNGDFTDTGYCQVLAEPLLNILRGEDK